MGIRNHPASNGDSPNWGPGKVSEGLVVGMEEKKNRVVNLEIQSQLGREGEQETIPCCVYPIYNMYVCMYM